MQSIITNFRVSDFHYAHNAMILAEAKPLNLSVSRTKTKIQDFGNLLGYELQSAHDYGENTKILGSFIYPGSVIQSKGGSTREVT